MTKSKDQIFEFACHEGNYGMANLLSGARAQEQASEATRPTKEQLERSMTQSPPFMVSPIAPDVLAYLGAAIGT
jgi:hypothetical protein